MLRPHRAAVPPQPCAAPAGPAEAAAHTAQQLGRDPGSGPAHEAPSPQRPRQRMEMSPVPSPVQQRDARQQQQQGQRQPAAARSASLATHSRPGAGHPPAVQSVPLEPAAGAAARQPQPHPQVQQLPPVDFSGVNPLLRRNAEYVYRTTGQLPPGAVPLAPHRHCQQPERSPQRPAGATGLDALLQLLPRPRGASLPPVPHAAPAAAALSGRGPASPLAAPLSHPLLRSSPVLPARQGAATARQQPSPQHAQHRPVPPDGLPDAVRVSGERVLHGIPAPDPPSLGAVPIATTPAASPAQRQHSAGLPWAGPAVVGAEQEGGRLGKRPRVAGMWGLAGRAVVRVAVF
jgi:hypothetical protein